MIRERIQLPAYLLLSTLGLAFTPAPANADLSDDYVACLVGKAAVALHKQDKKDSGKALEIAHMQCREPKGVSENELEGLSDYVSALVDAMETVGATCCNKR